MESVLDYQLDFYSQFSLLFKVESYFNTVEKTEKILGVPFAVTAKEVNLKCTEIRQKQIDKTQYLYCIYPEYIEHYGRTGAKIVSCLNCPLNNQHNKR